jgi:hypothetical protein
MQLTFPWLWQGSDSCTPFKACTTQQLHSSPQAACVYWVVVTVPSMLLTHPPDCPDIVFEASDQLGSAEVREKAPFQVVTCMFAIHYFFAASEMLDRFLTNVATNLEPGGRQGMDQQLQQPLYVQHLQQPLYACKQGLRPGLHPRLLGVCWWLQAATSLALSRMASASQPT